MNRHCIKKSPLLTLPTIILVALLTLLLSACSQEKWVEGKHYEKISEPNTAKDNLKSPAKKNVREYFSFWCPHCYQAEPFMTRLASALPDDISFIKTHVNFMGFMPIAPQDAGTMSLMAARVNGSEKEFSDALFNRIHVERRELQSIDDFAALFAATSGNDKTLANVAKGFSVESMHKANDKFVTDIRPHLRGVPALVVNDKYVLDLTNNLSLQEMKELIVWLAAR